MAVYSIQTVFGRGEITPKLWSRDDIDTFKMGLKYCQNLMVMRQGGLRRRPGTQFIGEIKDSSKKARLIPFIFSASQAYMLELGDFYFRVYALGGRVGTVEVTTPWAQADLFALDSDQTNDVLDITHRAYQPERISRLSDTSWAVNPVPTKDGPYLPLNATATTLTPSSTGNAIPQMTSNNTPSGAVNASSISTDNMTWQPYYAFNRGGVWWRATGPIGWIEYTFPAPIVITGYSVQASYTVDVNNPSNQGPLNAPQTWTFEGYNAATSSWVVLDSEFAQTSWSASETRSFLFTNATAYTSYRLNVSANNSGTNLEIAELSMLQDPNTAAPITITASSTAGINNNAGFSASDIGRYITILGSDASYHPYKITSVVSTTVVKAIATGSIAPTIQPTAQWRLGAWGTQTGWPSHVATFEGRKVYARTDAQPSGIWATKSGGYGVTLDFSTTVPTADDDSITFNLTDVNEIAWIAESSDLFIGTAGAARTMGRDSANLPFSANNFRQSLASTYASQAIRPTKVGTSTIFASSFGRALREFVRDPDGVDYDTPDISLLSEHLLMSGVIELCYQQEPDSVVWAPNGKGELIGLTYEKSQSMAGMHRHVLGGGGVVESCATIPGTDRHEVWMIVRRTINGATKRYIERMAAPFESALSTTTPPVASAWYVDCGLQYNGAPSTTVSGLSHLEGQTVAILADGAVETQQVVTGGSVSLASGRAASVITVGLPYTSRARTLPSPLSQGDGSGLGRRKKVVSALVDLYDTGSLRVGRDASTAEEIDFRHTTDALGAAPPLANGFYDARFQSSWKDRGELEMIADGPLPATIRSLTLSLESEP